MKEQMFNFKVEPLAVVNADVLTECNIWSAYLTMASK